MRVLKEDHLRGVFIERQVNGTPPREPPTFLLRKKSLEEEDQSHDSRSSRVLEKEF